MQLKFNQLNYFRFQNKDKKQTHLTVLESKRDHSLIDHKSGVMNHMPSLGSLLNYKFGYLP